MAQTTERPIESAAPAPEPGSKATLLYRAGQRFPALRSRNFRVLWLGLIFSNAGAQVQMVAESWLILQLTNSPLALGIMSMAWGIPMVVLPMFGGAIADRFDRITVLKFTQSVEVVVPLILGVVIATGHLHVWILYVEAAIGGATLAFDNPARQALLPGLVAPEELMNATALNSAVWTGALMVGPALGGLLLSLVGPAWLFIINGVTTSAVLYALFTMRDVRNRNESRPERMLERLVGGVRFTWANRGVMALMIITAATGILGRSYNTLLPVFAKDLWHTGPSGYGLLLAAPGLGALIGAFGTAALGDIEHKGRFVIISNFVYCGSLFVFALVPPFLGGMALLAIAGLASTAFGAAIGTMLQFATPGPLRGRVMSLYAIMVMGAPSLGGLLGGAVAESASAQLAVGGGVLLLGVVTLLLIRPVTRPIPVALEGA
ncbi:MAG TPA: MFS transporter [Thermomicrobiaceae bacterium]|nr:MFS transporter [Thermomicrobiaceae bacterium]